MTDVSRRDQEHNRRIGNIVKSLGFERERVQVEGVLGNLSFVAPRKIERCGSTQTGRCEMKPETLSSVLPLVPPWGDKKIPWVSTPYHLCPPVPLNP